MSKTTGLFKERSFAMVAKKEASDRPEAPPQLKLENQLCFSLYSASRLFVQAYQPLLKPLDLTYPQYLVMLVLWEQGVMSVSELGDKLILDSGTLSPLLKKLEQKKFLTRERSIKDERSVIVALTDRGTKLRTKAEEIPAKLLCLTKSSVEEIKNLKVQVENLARDFIESQK